MGSRDAPSFSGQIVHLIMRGRRPQTLVQSEDDWRAVGVGASRMLFWCGGCIFGCRCERNEIHFAVQVAHAPIGAMAQHFSAAYAAHLWNRRRWGGIVFKHYRAAPLRDEFFLDDLVMLLHRPAPRPIQGQINDPLFTGDAAYTVPCSLPWISTGRVFQALSVRSPEAAYRWRKTQPIAPEILQLLAGHAARRRPRQTAIDAGHEPPVCHARRRPSVETIARAVAGHCHVSLEDMRSPSRKREVRKAKVIATVLCTRNGATAAAAARLFNRSRSTLTEQAERYRKTQPQIFTDAEAALESFLAPAAEQT